MRRCRVGFCRWSNESRRPESCACVFLSRSHDPLAAIARRWLGCLRIDLGDAFSLRPIGSVSPRWRTLRRCRGWRAENLSAQGGFLRLSRCALPRADRLRLLQGESHPRTATARSSAPNGAKHVSPETLFRSNLPISNRRTPVMRQTDAFTRFSQRRKDWVEKHGFCGAAMNRLGKSCIPTISETEIAARGGKKSILRHSTQNASQSQVFNGPG